MAKLTKQQRVYVETTVNEVEVMDNGKKIRLGLKQQCGKLSLSDDTDPDSFAAPLDESVSLRYLRLKKILYQLGAPIVWVDIDHSINDNHEEDVYRYVGATFDSPSAARDAAVTLRTECRLKNDKSHLPLGEERVKITKKTMLIAAVALAVVVGALIIMK